MIYTDNCCSDRDALVETVARAAIACPRSSASVASTPDPPLPALEFPTGMVLPKPIVVRSPNCSFASHACSQLLEQARNFAHQFPGDAIILGFDCEWAPSLSGRRLVAVIQISCVNGYTVIFHVNFRSAGRSAAAVMPNALRDLMENDEIQLVSVRIIIAKFDTQDCFPAELLHSNTPTTYS